MARPRKVVDPNKVQELAARGCTPEEIAPEVGASAPTLNRRFDKALKNGRLDLNRTIKSELYRQAMAGNIACLIFMAKAYCGLRENDPTTNISVTANANSGYRTPSMAEFRQRALDADAFYRKHNFGLDDEPPANRLENNGA